MSHFGETMSAAININVLIPGSNDAYYKSPSGVLHTVSRTGFYAAGAKEQRPASIHTTKTSNGWRPPTPWSHTIDRFWNPVVDGTSGPASGGWTCGWTGDTNLMGYAGTGALPSLGTVVDRAINKALLKLSNQQTDLGENFAERRQADRMIGDRIDRYTSQLTGRYIARHRRDWRRVKAVSPFVRHGMKFPNSWLEFQYGIQPLLNDIYGAYNVIKGVDKDWRTFRCSVKAFVKNDDTVTVSSFNINPGDPFLGQQFMADVTSTGKSGAFVRLDYALVNPVLAELQQLGLVNPALLAWNLAPYSFVWDWALPVGNYLQAWTADLGWQFIGGSISTKQTLSRTVSNPRHTYGTAPTSITLMGGSALCMSFKRVVLNSSPAPRLPHFKNPLSLHHAANALSLLAVALRS